MQQKKCNNREFSLSIFSRIVFMKRSCFFFSSIFYLIKIPSFSFLVQIANSVQFEEKQVNLVLLKDWEIEHIFPSKMGYWSPSLCLPNFQSSSSSTWVSASKIPTLEGSLASYSNGGETLVGELEEKIPFKRGVMHTHSSRELHALYLIF